MRNSGILSAQKIGARCPRCGNDAWGVEGRKTVVCRVCKPEGRGPRAWPRLVTVRNDSGKPILAFCDSSRMKLGQTALVYRERWGYRIVRARLGAADGKAARRRKP